MKKAISCIIGGLLILGAVFIIASNRKKYAKAK